MLEIDFDALKTPIYTGINDRIVPATENKASNASDLIDRVNSLVDTTKNIYNDVYEQINDIPKPSGLLPDWIPVDNSWYVDVNQSYLILPQMESIFIHLPYNGLPGHFVCLLKLNPNTQVEIQKHSYHLINGVDNWSSVYLTGTKQIVYIFATKPREDLLDWITVDDSAFQFNPSAG